jgi:hypothetical protein
MDLKKLCQISQAVLNWQLIKACLDSDVVFCGIDRVNLWDFVLPQSFSQWLLVCMSNTLK